MKFRIKCLIGLVIVAMSSFCVSASDTTTKFQTGPFTVTVDLGTHCNDTNISKPVSNEDLGGNGYTDYDANLCKAEIWIRQWGKDATYSFDLNSAFPTESILQSLIKLGADKDTINLYARTIDGKPGAAGSGYVPKLDKMRYSAAFYVSPKSFCRIYIWGNEL